MRKKLIVTTSWDDGHILDIKLASLLKKYNIKGTFYVSPKNREFPKQKLLTSAQIIKLSKYFEIGAHTVTHPDLTKIDSRKAEKEIKDSKVLLENILKKKITSFCYPKGAFSSIHSEIVKNVGFKYARTVKRFSVKFSKNMYRADTTIHAYAHWTDIWKIALFARFHPLKIIQYLQWDNLAKALFDHAVKNGDVYHLWGHSWEIQAQNGWQKLEEVLSYISGKQDVIYMSNQEMAEKRSPMKLLISSPYFPPHTGGLEFYVYNLAKKLNQLFGIKVVIVTSGKQFGKFTIEEKDNIKVYRLPFLFKVSNTPVNPFWLADVKRIIKIEKPDIINAHIPVPFLADITALVCGNIPYVITYHTDTMKKGVFLPDLIVWVYEKFLGKYAIRKAQKIISSSEYVRNNFLKKYIKKSYTITPGVNPTFFSVGDKKYKNTILFVGGLNKFEEYKGLKYLLESVSQIKLSIPAVKLVIVGDGNNRENFEKMVSQLGLKTHVEFKGRVFGPALVKMYQQASVLVLPSLNDSFPMVLLEAMACGIPVIGTNIGGIPTIIDNNKNGFLIPPKDVQTLTKKLVLILKNEKLAGKLGKNGRKKVVKELTWDHQAKKSYDFFEQIRKECI